MVDRMEFLREGGVNVHLVTGRSGQVAGCSGNFSGIQHSKCLLVDAHAIVGSTNWTNAARKNHEISVLLTLGEEGLAEYDRCLSLLDKMSHEITGGDIKQGRAHRTGSARTRSAETSMRGSQLKDGDLGLKSSIARQRTASMGS